MMTIHESIVYGAVGEAMRHLGRIDEHFRNHKQQDTANLLGKLCVKLVEVVDEGMNHILEDESIIDVRGPNGSDFAAAGSEDPVSVGIQQQATMAVRGEVDMRESETRSHAMGRLPAPPGLTIQPVTGSWAQIANRSDTTRPSQEAAQLMSPDASVSSREAVAAHPAAPSEPVEEKAGVVRIYGSARKGEFRHITSRIREGPLQEVRVESNNSVRVVFQHVSHALEFVKSDEEMQQRLGQGRIGKNYTVEMADIIDWNDDLRLMKQPVRERRRLSFARKGLFTGGLTEVKWKHEMLTTAGIGNVDFLWVFNSGNATAVFSSTIVARKVLDTVKRWSDNRRDYLGVSVGYSSDTCEKELILLRENNQPCYHRHGQPRRSMLPPRRPDYRQG